MGLNPAIILLSISVWGTLLGFVGFIIALPLTTLLLAYYDQYISRREDGESDEEHDRDIKALHEMTEFHVRVHGVYNAEQCGGYYRYELQIGHHVQQPDEHSEHDGQRHADYGKSDAEQDADAERHESLTAEIVVHAVFDVACHGKHYGAALRGHHAAEAAEQTFVVEHYEHYVQHTKMF